MFLLWRHPFEPPYPKGGLWEPRLPSRSTKGSALDANRSYARHGRVAHSAKGARAEPAVAVYAELP